MRLVAILKTKRNKCIAVVFNITLEEAFSREIVEEN
jgi:hypothetical protein